MTQARATWRADFGALAAVSMVCAAGLLAGCSLSDDFDGYTFGDDAGRDAGDGGSGGEGGLPDGALPDGGAECRFATECGPGMRCIRGTCVMAPPPPTGLFQTNGGGTMQSGSYRIRIGVGAPQPMGSMRSGSYEVELGPIHQQP